MPYTNIRDIANIVLNEALNLTQSQHGYVSRIDPKTGANVLFSLKDLSAQQCRILPENGELVFHRGSDGRFPGLWGHALNTRKSFYTNQAKKHPSACGTPPGHLELARFLSVPILLEDELAGQIALANSPVDYTDHDLEAVEHLSSLYASAFQRLRLEEKLQIVAEQRLMALEAGKLGTWDFDLLTGEVHWDERCRSLFGLSAGGNIPYERVIGLIHEADRYRVDRTVKAALAGNSSGSYQAEYRVVWPEGPVRWVMAHGQVHFQGEGQGRQAVRFIGTVQDITERKLVETALQESIEQFRTVLEHSNDAIFWADPETGILIRCNRKAEELTERSREELVGMHQSLLHPADRNYAEMFRRASAHSKFSDIEAEILSRTGKRIPVLINSSLVIIGERKIVQGVFRDMRGRKRMEAALQESERRFRALFEQAAIGVAQIDTATGFYQHVNHKFCNIVGYSRDELLAINFQQLTHPEDLPRNLQNIEALSKGKLREFSMEKRYLKKGGGTVWVKITASPLWQNGEPPLAYVAVVEDISRRKQTEEALELAWAEMEDRVEKRTAELRQANESLQREIEIRRKAEKELTEAEFRYRTVVEFTHDWAYWESPDGSLRYCSPSCQRITGYSAQDFMGNPQLLQQIIHSEDVDLWQKQREEVRNGLEPKLIQLRICRRDGSTGLVEHVCQPVFSQEGSFLGLRAGSREITQRVEAELERQRLREELARATRVTTAGQFAASLAHELNQPLAAIHFNTQAAERFLAMDPPRLAEVQDALTDIRNDSQRAGKVIYHLRALFKKTGHEKSLLQLNEVVEETILLLQNEFLLKNVTHHLCLEAQLPAIQGNRVELQQVILNLVVNALEAMNEVALNQRRLWITTTWQSPQRVVLSVRDSGPGIAPVQLGQIFKPFYTTKPSGMGMGLVICQTVVEAHGGRMWVENNSDQGATFSISLSIDAEHNL